MVDSNNPFDLLKEEMENDDVFYTFTIRSKSKLTLFTECQLS